MKDTKWGNEYRLTMVCIDSYDNEELTGRFYNPYLVEGKSFKSLVQLLKAMEDLLDDMNFPQSFTTVKTFTSQSAQKQSFIPDCNMQQGELATFGIRVIFRQNASWQGTVTWLDQGKEQSFRSVLELILLMDNALRDTASA